MTASRRRGADRGRTGADCKPAAEEDARDFTYSRLLACELRDDCRAFDPCPLELFR